MQQAVCVEGVIDAAPLVHVEGKAQGLPTLADVFARGGGLLGGGAVLFVQVFGDVLALRNHLGVQLKGLEMDVRLDLALQPLQGGLQALQPNGTPRARDIGDKVDF